MYFRQETLIYPVVSVIEKRKKKSEPGKSKNLQQIYRNKRTYVDFERFMEAHPDLDVVEMDTVKGGRIKENASSHFYLEAVVL